MHTLLVWQTHEWMSSFLLRLSDMRKKNRIANSDRLHKESIMSHHIKQTNQPNKDTLTLIIVFCVSIKYGLLLLLFYSSLCLSLLFGRHFPLSVSLTICGQLQIMAAWRAISKRHTSRKKIHGESNWMLKMNIWRAFYAIYCFLCRAMCILRVLLTSGTPHHIVSFMKFAQNEQQRQQENQTIERKMKNPNRQFKPKMAATMIQFHFRVHNFFLCKKVLPNCFEKVLVNWQLQIPYWNGAICKCESVEIWEKIVVAKEINLSNALQMWDDTMRFVYSLIMRS